MFGASFACPDRESQGGANGEFPPDSAAKIISPSNLLRASYTPNALAALITNPHSREQEMRTIVENLGGTLEGWWLAFGEDGVDVVLRMPDETNR